jgi:hypothetical protein
MMKHGGRHVSDEPEHEGHDAPHGAHVAHPVAVAHAAGVAREADAPPPPPLSLVEQAVACMGATLFDVASFEAHPDGSASLGLQANPAMIYSLSVERLAMLPPAPTPAIDPVEAAPPA